MKTFLMRYATPLTAGLFLVSGVSGVALFLGWQQGIFHSMHEILSLVLIVPVGIHLWRNWRPFLNYFRHTAMPIALAASVVAAGYFAFGSSSGGGGNPAFALVAAAQDAPIATLAPVLGLDPAVATQRLAEAGFGTVTEADSVSGIADRNAVEPFAVLAPLVAAPAS